MQPIAVWAEQDLGRFFEVFWRAAHNGRLVPVPAYKPEYFRTMLARLYLFGGEGRQPAESCWLARHTVGRAPSGRVLKLLRASRRFANYDEAEAFLEEHTAEGWQLVSFDPVSPCVPLEPVARLRRVYDSPHTRIGGLPAVRVFEVVVARP
jgi:hypothetical protein